VHAKRWLEHGRWGAIGIVEGALGGFAGAVLVLMPGILTKPNQAPPYQPVVKTVSTGMVSGR